MQRVECWNTSNVSVIYERVYMCVLVCACVCTGRRMCALARGKACEPRTKERGGNCLDWQPNANYSCQRKIESVSQISTAVCGQKSIKSSFNRIYYWITSVNAVAVRPQICELVPILYDLSLVCYVYNISIYNNASTWSKNIVCLKNWFNWVFFL